MPRVCRLLPGRPENPQPGDMWFDHGMLNSPVAAYYRQHHLARGYVERHMETRPPLWVVVPGGWPICIDARPTQGQEWIVSGTPPAITVTPEINVSGYYRGFLIDGVFLDDLDGRTYT